MTMSWRIAFVKRSLPAIRNWKNSSLRREDLCRRTNSEWRWSESGARTYTPRGPCTSHSKNTPRGLHTSSSLDQLVVLKLHLPQSIQSVKTKTLQDLLAAISNNQELRGYQWTLCAPLAAATSDTTAANCFCVTTADPSSSQESMSTCSAAAQEGSTSGESDTGTDTILVDMYHNIGDPCQAKKARCEVESITKCNLCENQENIMVIVMPYTLAKR